jgi:hypothetical protein
MKQFMLCALVFACGVTCGASVSFASQIQRACLRGVSEGLHACHRDAVREGHGEWHFSRPGDETEIPVFRWYNTRPYYQPDTRINAPGILD